MAVLDGGDALPRGTDRVRLESIIKELKEALGAVLGLGKFGGVERERVDVSTGEIVRVGGEGATAGLGDIREAVDDDDQMEVATPSLVDDDDGESMVEAEEELEDDEDDDAEFEEVEVVSPRGGAIQQRGLLSGANDDQELFSIHFTAPSPAPPVEAPVPITQRRREVEMDEEFGLGRTGAGTSPSGAKTEEEDGDDEDNDDDTIEEIQNVFLGTMKILDEYKRTSES